MHRSTSQLVESKSEDMNDAAGARNGMERGHVHRCRDGDVDKHNWVLAVQSRRTTWLLVLIVEAKQRNCGFHIL